MTSEEDFLKTLPVDKQHKYRELETNPDFGNLLQNVLSMREYRAFSTIRVPAYPPFMKSLCNKQQMDTFLAFVSQKKWAVCDSWMTQYSQHKYDYEKWKALYLAIGHNPAASAPPVPTAISNISIVIPPGVKKTLEGRGGITLRRITRETKAKIQLKAVNGQKAQIVVSSDVPTNIVAGCREVMRTLAIHQKQNECVYDSKLANFVASWSKDDILLFQWRYSCSLIPSIAADDRNSMLLLKTWSPEEKKIAVTKVKELNANKKKPSAEAETNDLIQLLRELKSGDSYDSIPEYVNILVLGETGVGKSTFLNAMINYLKYSTLEEAESNGAEVVVPADFTYTDYENTMHKIVALPKGEDNSGLNQNEDMELGASKTQEPVSYVYVLPGTQEKYIRIIDTPGVADTRGLGKDEENFEKIMSYIADFPEIHCILLLAKPDSNRLTISFKYCVQELLGHLHKSASENVIFGFTHAQQTFFRPGQTHVLLQTLLDELKATNNVDVPVKTTYSFDSNSFLYLAGRLQNVKYAREEVNRFKESWIRGKEETTKMFEHIYKLKPHDVNKTLCINNTRKVIQILSKPIGEITKNLLINENQLQKALDEVTQLRDLGKSLEGKLTVDQVVLETEELESPQTVCMSPGCVTNENVGGVVKAVPKQICDPNCGHRGVQTETLSNPKLQTCKAMKNGTCMVCGCNWQTHVHIRYKINSVMKKVVDEDVQQKLNNANSELERANIFINNTKRQIEELKRNKELIMKHSTEFALFAAESSMLAVNDAYGEYLKTLIHVEKTRSSLQNDNTLLLKLEEYKDTYEEQAKLLKAASVSKTSGKPTRSVDEIHKLIEELKALEICGTLLQEMQKLEIDSVRSTEKYASRKVELTNWKQNLSWLFTPVANLFSRMSL